MNAPRHLLFALLLRRLDECRRLDRLRAERPPCAPRIESTRVVIRQIDTRLFHEIGGVSW
ncbi:MAG: hypothetical protein WDN30_14350 [Pararobbsia sp.]